MLEEDSYLKRDEISKLGDILNSKTEVLVGFSAEHRIVKERGYRFAPSKNIVDVRNLLYQTNFSHHFIRRIKAAYLLGRLYRSTQNESEKKIAEKELKKCRLGRFFMYL